MCEDHIVREVAEPGFGARLQPGGYRRLIDAFEQRIKSQGGTVRLRARAAGLAQTSVGIELVLEDGEREAFDYVVVTSPLSAFQALTLAGSRPAALWMPPVESLTAMILAPSAASRVAAMDPALP